MAQRLPDFITSGTWRWWCQPHAPAAFTPRKCFWYSFSLGAESTPGPCYGRKAICHWKSSDNTGNRSRGRPTPGPGVYGNRGIYFFQVLKFKPTNTQRYIDVTVLLHSPSTLRIRACFALTNLSFINSQQAKAMFHFKNIKENLYKSLPDDGLVRPKHVHAGVGSQCNSIITLIQLCAFVGLNCNNWILIHGMENGKLFVPVENRSKFRYISVGGWMIRSSDTK
jgi:hypothetical protein